MKTKLLSLVILLLLAVSASADITVSNLLTYTSVNNTTNNGTPTAVGSAYVPIEPTFNIQSGGLSDTNALVVYIEYGLDTNSFTPIYTFRQSSTNAGDYQVTPGTVTLTIYARTKVVTTNNVSVGTKAIFNSTP